MSEAKEYVIKPEDEAKLDGMETTIARVRRKCNIDECKVIVHIMRYIIFSDMDFIFVEAEVFRGNEYLGLKTLFGHIISFEKRYYDDKDGMEVELVMRASKYEKDEADWYQKFKTPIPLLDIVREEITKLVKEVVDTTVPRPTLLAP